MGATSTTEATPGKRRRIVSVRTRIVATITLVAAIGLLAVGVTLYVVEHGKILAQVDERLEANLESARFIVGQGPVSNGTTQAWPSATAALETVVQRMSPDDNTGAAGIVDGRAALVPGVPLDVDLLTAPGFVDHLNATITDEPRRGTYAEEGVTWRYVGIPITLAGSPPPETVLFVMVYDINAELQEINELAVLYLVTAGIVLVLTAGAAWIVAGRLLRPLRHMRRTAEQISARSLSERLPVHGSDDVSELAGTMNAMLDRLDAAMDSQRQLVSDVGHELKTPMTIVRGYLEVMDPNDPADVRDTQNLAIDELDRMAQLVQDLASAARLHGPAPISPVATDAGDLMHQIIRKAEGIDGATVSAGPIADVVFPVDPARITQALLQLAQNGVTHGGGQLEIGSTVQGDTVYLWVRDHGSGVPPEIRDTIFERFSRSESGGSGLGLNIVDVIARAHGGTAGVTDPPSGSGSLFYLSLPRIAQANHERTPHGVDSHRR
ncbi:HAMP domain-containing sensor histidine kinase [Microbacterium sp. NC79]|uniref:sensor histidine kinase n=1 Tax=Microbacterium sp. NC79 TaxID=2851009 RepID=UPI001C2CB58D|nr:HAMP domain-containing histidine kinase [Microbacterium sp. NC79]